MITRAGIKYCDLIVEQLEQELKPSNDELQRIRDRFNRKFI